MTKRALITAALAAVIMAQPLAAQELSDDFLAGLDQVQENLQSGFEKQQSDPVEALALFEASATQAEAMLEANPDIGERDRLDLHQQAGYGWYYVGEAYDYVAARERDVSNRSDIVAQKVAPMERALEHFAIVFADENSAFNPAEYYFAASALAVYGESVDHPRKVEWARTEVHAARMRVQDSGSENARFELIQALVNYGKLAGDEAATEEAITLFADLPKDNWRAEKINELLEAD